MPRVRLDVATAVLAVSSVIGALALVGIFIVYLVDHNSNDNKQSNASTTASTTPSVTTPTLPSGTTSSTSGSSASAPAGSTSGARTSAGTKGGATGAAGVKSTPQSTVALNKIRPNQAYVSYVNPQNRFSMLYPQGWVSSKAPGQTAGFTHNGDAMRIYAQQGAMPTVSVLTKDLLTGLGGQGKIGPGAPGFKTIGGKRLILVRFTRVLPGGQKLVGHQFVLARGKAHVIVNFTNPAGVDNRRAYTKMISSFRFL
jgi:hypothetical protein